ncbi:MAG: cyclophane-forming radical SAM/SPASM peptide maturase GrrM/OscB [Myxococcaceae bacterium]
MAEVVAPGDSSGRLGPLDLLILQPTPFCNLDCSYCYLPDRGNTQRMSEETLEWTFRRVAESDLVERPYTVVWHAGEPLVLPAAFYQQAFELAERLLPRHVPFTHSFQTNGTLIDADFCELLRNFKVRVGVSVDGPAFLNDRYRKTRRGTGTLSSVLAGIAVLRKSHIPFHVITVLTRESLDYPDELCEFYRAEGIEHVGLNIEEIEGPHVHSSLVSDDSTARYEAFMSRFFDLAQGQLPRLHVREFDNMLASVLYDGDKWPGASQEAQPFAIVSVDHQGNFSTFSPELLGLPSVAYGGFSLGNVRSHSFREASGTARYQKIAGDISAGVSKCRATCAYFAFCGGGAPGNKFFENGSFDSTETLFCRLHRKALAEVMLSKLRPRVGVSAHEA